jgi:hypothetical protein
MNDFKEEIFWLAFLVIGMFFIIISMIAGVAVGMKLFEMILK